MARISSPLEYPVLKNPRRTWIFGAIGVSSPDGGGEEGGTILILYSSFSFSPQEVRFRFSPKVSGGPGFIPRMLLELRGTWLPAARRLEWTTDMSARSDAELYLEAGRGDAAAFSLLVSRYTDELLGFFRRRVRDEAAEDLLQETFLRLHKAAPRFVPQASFRTFLYTIARNLALNFHRDARPSVAIGLEPAATDADALESAELSA